MSHVPDGYVTFIDGTKTRVQVARVRAARLVSAELVHLYWQIGTMIAEREERHGSGARVIDRLSTDLRVAPPDMRSRSPRNLR